MADEPENLTLKLLREIRDKQNQFEEKQNRFEAEQERFASLLGKVADAVTQIATTQERHSEVLAQHSALLGKLYEIQQNNGARLNVIEGRLAIIEKHTGLVK